MDLKIENQLFIVCGATSGFGLSTVNALVGNGAKIIAIARGRQKLDKLKQTHPSHLETLCGDIIQPNTQVKLLEQINQRKISGAFINAGGPPAMKFLATQMDDWDMAYRQLLRWKVKLVHLLIPLMIPHGYGRMVFLESAAVKQPLENLVLSTSLRLAVVGFVKTLSHEIADSGITLNILAPGFHDTPALNRLLEKKSEQDKLSPEEVRNLITQSLPSGKMGNPQHVGQLAAWLLSPLSEYITGQTISVDGGLVSGIFG